MSFYTDFPKYPTAIFNDTDYPAQVNDVNVVYADLINALKEEMQACFTELGLLPKGAYASVKARLDAQGKKIQDADADTSWDTEETADKDEIQGKVAGVEFFRGHDDGIITLAKQSGCRGYLATANQSIASKTHTKCEFNAETYDNQNEFDSTINYRFTATRSGYYLVSGSVYLLSLADGKFIHAFIYKNGVEVARNKFTTGVAGSLGQSVVDIIYLAINDYIELWVYHSDVVARDLYASEAATFISISKLQ